MLNRARLSGSGVAAAPASGEPRSFPRETLPAIVNRMAAISPDRIFVMTTKGDRATWAELQTLMRQWAARFVALQVTRGDVVVTLLDSGMESLGAWLGLASLGAIDAATNPEFRGRMLAYAIDNCRPDLLVVQPEYLPAVSEIASELSTVKRILLLAEDTDGARIGANPYELVYPQDLSLDIARTCDVMKEPALHDIACITYTSGTTGPSKAVLLPWGQLHSVNLGTFPFQDLTSSDIFYCTTSHAHFGSKSIPYLAAMAGGQVVIRPRFGLTSFWSDITRFGVTTAMLVGSMTDMLINDPESPTGPTTLVNLFMAPLGSAYEEFSRRFGVRICTVYNSTEGGVAIRSGWNPTDGRFVGRLREGYPGFDVRIVDENDFEVPDGTPGECVVRSSVPWVMNAGYLHNPEATMSAWRNGWFHTGDALVRSPSGDYMFVDRLKDVIRRRGENISSFDLEADVLRNPAIIECAAVAVPADTVEDEVLLFAVRRPTTAITPDELCADLESRMARFMVPRYIEFIDSLPKTQATQRIIKDQLRLRGIGPQTWDRQRDLSRTSAARPARSETKG